MSEVLNDYQKKFLTQTNLSLQITRIFICLPEIFREKEDLTFEITVEETFLTFLTCSHSPQPVFTCSNSTMETPEQYLKSVRS